MGDVSLSKLEITLVQRIFRYNLLLSEPLLDSIHRTLHPYESRLHKDPQPAPIPALSKYTNLYTLHIRHGAGEADFQDSATFLKPNATQIVFKCMNRTLHPEDLIFVASDSSKTKQEFRRVFGDRVIVANASLSHSAISVLQNKETKEVNNQVVIDVLTDMMIASMGSQFIGTYRSTLSAMVVLLGAPQTKYVSSFNGNCYRTSIYLPS